MREVTRQNIDKRILIMIEGEARTAPYIRTTIGEHAMITGQFTREEAKRIADGMVERQ
jgi:preprotein translocase subunit SecD